jgi:hypothetical protein
MRTYKDRTEKNDLLEGLKNTTKNLDQDSRYGN